MANNPISTFGLTTTSQPYRSSMLTDGTCRIIHDVPRWIGASTAAQTYGLTYDQVVQAVMMGIVRGSETGMGMLVNPVDIEANLDRIRSFSQYSKKELAARHRHNVRRRLRERLAFRCPRCGKKVYPLDSYVFEGILMGDVDYGGAREDLVIQHYFHVHTDYEKDHQDVDKRLRPEEVYEATKGKFQSFKSLIE